MKISKILTKIIFIFLISFCASLISSRVFAEPGSISGIVCCEETLLPLDGVQVKLRTQVEESEEMDSTITIEGNYQFEAVPAGVYYVATKLSGYGTTLRPDIQVYAGEETVNQDVYMTNDPGRICGRVTNEDGEPLVGGGIWVNAERGPIHLYIDTSDSPDEEGYYELGDLAPRSDYWVEACHFSLNGVDYANICEPDVTVNKGEDTTLNFVLQEAATIHGTVTDVAGNPIEGVLVNFGAPHSSGSPGEASDITDENGQYTLRYVLPYWTYIVSVVPPPDTDYIRQRFDYYVPSAGDCLLDITLQSGVITISGVATDANTSALLENIRICYSNHSEQIFTNEYTGPFGSYEFTNLPPGQAEVGARPDFDYAWENIQGEFLQDTILNFELGPESTISGTVTDSADNPTEGVVISFWAGSIFDNDTTDENGQYTLRHLNYGQTYPIKVEPPSDTRFIRQEFDFDIPTQGDYLLDIILQSGAITISGVVTDVNTSVPLENIPIHYLHYSEQLYTYDFTGPDGSYELTNLPPGQAEVSAAPGSGYAWQTAIDEFLQDTTLDFALVPENTMSGLIKDAETGEPILENLLIKYINLHKMIFKETYTNPTDGSFSFTECQEGVVRLQVRPEPNSGYAWIVYYFYIPEGEDLTNIDLLIKQGALISGSVQDTQGGPMPFINLGSVASGRDMTETQSDAEGNFAIRLSPAKHTIGISSSEDCSAIPQELTIASIEDNRTLQIVGYDQNTAEFISGEVFNPQDLLKQSNFFVATFNSEVDLTQDSIIYNQPIDFAMLEEAGPFELLVPPERDYTVLFCVWDGELYPQRSVTVRELLNEVPAGQTDQNFYYDSVGGTVTGIVTYNNEPVLYAYVHLEDLEGNLVGFAKTDQNGLYCLYNVPAGNYMISAWDPDHLRSPEYRVQDLVDEGTTEVDIEMNSAQFDLTTFLQGYLNPGTLVQVPADISLEFRELPSATPNQIYNYVSLGEQGDATLAVQEGSYYIVVNHFNHVAVITAAPVNFTLDQITPVNISDSNSDDYVLVYGIEPMWDEGGGIYSLRAGDANDDGVVDESLDFSIWHAANGSMPGDPTWDDRANFNGDEVVNACGDFVLWRLNNDRESYVPEAEREKSESLKRQYKKSNPASAAQG